MFEQEIRATFAAQQQQFANDLNAHNADLYDRACKDWALNYGRGGVQTTPFPAKKVRAEVAFEPEFSAKLIETDYPVSTRTPQSYLPVASVQSVDVVGPEIVGAPGHYEDHAIGAKPEGEVVTDGTTTYIRRRYFFGLGSYWEKVSK